jgi:hypothetical protein
LYVSARAAEGRRRVADEKPSEGVRRVLDSGTKARKWILGIVVAAVAAVITSYVTGGITSGVDRVRGSFEEEPAPLGVTVTRLAKEGSGHWVFAQPMKAVKAIPLPNRDLGALETWDAWAHSHGGMDASSTGVRFIVEGATSHPVVLTGLTAEIVERLPPPRGVHVVPFGGGGLPTRRFEVNLDESPPTVRSLAAAPELESAPPPIDFPYRVSATDPEVFLMIGSTLACDCAWRANLEWVYQGKKGMTVIDDAGRPFRTVSPSRSAIYYPKFDRG